MKDAWINAHRKEYGFADPSVSASGYRAWKGGGTPERKRLTDAQMVAPIRAIHAELKVAYGSPRITRDLRDRGFPASRERVGWLMRENGIRARYKLRFKATTDSKHSLPVAPNLLDREFSPTAPNQVCTADLTYIWTDEGWLYLAVVLDQFNREVVGRSIKPRMTADIVIDALTMTWFRQRPASGLIHHSDRGSQHASHAFQARLKEYGMVCSMSRNGKCWDNAPTGSFFNSLKNERVHGARYGTRAEAAADLFDYIEPFYNRRREHSTLDDASPMKFLEHWISAQHEQQLEA